MLCEFWEDYYAQNPLESYRNADGYVQFKNTGDPLIDKWEDQIAQGEKPDFLEGFTPEQLEKLDKLREKGKARARGGPLVQSMKAVVDAVDEDARRQGLRQTGRLPARKGWNPGDHGLGPPSKFPSTFGSGSD